MQKNQHYKSNILVIFSVKYIMSVHTEMSSLLFLSWLILWCMSLRKRFNKKIKHKINNINDPFPCTIILFYPFSQPIDHIIMYIKSRLWNQNAVLWTMKEVKVRWTCLTDKYTIKSFHTPSIYRWHCLKSHKNRQTQK